VSARIRRLLRAPGAGRDVLGEYRDRIMLPMAVCSSALLVPFVVVDYLAGKHVLAFMMLAVVLPLALDALALWRGRKPPVDYGWLMLPVAAAIAISLLEHGVHGAMWCYPAILFCYFVLPGWQATVGAASLVAMASVLVLQILGLPTMVRFAVTAALSIVFIHIILGVVGELQRKLFEQATTDPLTGALNRRQMSASLADAIEHSRRGGHAVALLVFDLDHFKRINDAHGHAAGDQALQRLVARVHERARRIDRLFRMGGEEFALLLPNTTESDAVRVAEKLRARIAQAEWPCGATVTVSIGVAQLHAAQTQDGWLKAADEALYRAKDEGRDCVRVAARPAGYGDPFPGAMRWEALATDIADVAE
jgi:diguanylate cyclase (GGDEF)-like protein